QLVIAGTIDTAPPELRTALEKLKKTDTHLFLHFIPDSELNVFMSAADAVILPYKAILNSGALLLALSYNRPVIAPHMGAVAELQKTLGQQWIYSYNGNLTGENVTEALSTLECNNRPDVCPLDNYNWDKLATYTLTFYRKLQAVAPELSEF